MSEPRIRTNAILNAILSVSSVIFPLITFRYASRILTPEGIGRVDFAAGLLSYFSMFAQLGIPTYGIRAIASARDQKEKLAATARELLHINLASSLLSFIVFLGLILFVPRFQEDRVLYLMFSATIFLNALGMEWLYRGLEQYRYITVRSLIFKLIALIGVLLLIHSSEDVLIYGFLTIFAASASNIVNFIHASRILGKGRDMKLNYRQHLQPVLVFFAMSCATTIYTHLDAVMLGLMKTNTDVGYYSAAVKIKSILVQLITSLGAVLLPRCSYYIEKGEREKFWNISRKAVHLVTLLSVPLALTCILFAREDILFLSGVDFAPAALPMQLIMPTLFLVGITNILGIQIMIPLGREKQVLLSEIGGALTDLVLNLILIPRWGVAGAAFATMVAEIVVFGIQLYLLRQEKQHFFSQVEWGKEGLALLAAAAAALGIRALMPGHPWLWVAGNAAFLLCYGIILLLLKETLVTELAGDIGNRLRRLRGRNGEKREENHGQ